MRWSSFSNSLFYANFQVRFPRWKSARPRSESLSRTRPMMTKGNSFKGNITLFNSTCTQKRPTSIACWRCSHALAFPTQLWIRRQKIAAKMWRRFYSSSFWQQREKKNVSWVVVLCYIALFHVDSFVGSCSSISARLEMRKNPHNQPSALSSVALLYSVGRSVGRSVGLTQLCLKKRASNSKYERRDEGTKKSSFVRSFFLSFLLQLLFSPLHLSGRRRRRRRRRSL